MAKVDFLRKTSNDIVATDTGTIFYPVSTIDAVYYDETRTLNDVLNGSFSEDNPMKSNGIYSTLQNMSEKMKEYITNEKFDEKLKMIDDNLKCIDDLKTEISNLKSLVNTLSVNIKKELDNLKK